MRRLMTLVEAKVLKTYKVAWGRNQHEHLGTETVRASSETMARRITHKSLDDRFFRGHGMKVLYVIEVAEETPA